MDGLIWFSSSSMLLNPFIIISHLGKIQNFGMFFNKSDMVMLGGVAYFGLPK